MTDRHVNHIWLDVDSNELGDDKKTKEEYVSYAPPLVVGNLVFGERYVEP